MVGDCPGLRHVFFLIEEEQKKDIAKEFPVAASTTPEEATNPSQPAPSPAAGTGV